MRQPSPPIDHTHLENVSGGDREFETELMREFLSSTPPLLADLEKAIQAGDFKRTEISAHTLKGSCRSLGAVAMSEPCLAIERNARAGSLEGSSELYREACARYQALCAYIETIWDIKAA